MTVRQAQPLERRWHAPCDTSIRENHVLQDLWYKDAIVYQLHVKTFRDSNGDGIGDACALRYAFGFTTAMADVGSTHNPTRAIPTDDAVSTICSAIARRPFSMA